MKRLLLLLPLLGGCSYYFDTGLDRQLSRRVEERLKNDEGLPLEQFSLTPPVGVEQALPKFKEGRPPSGRTLPPEKPALSGAEGPALSGAEGPALSGAEGPALSGAEGPALSGAEGPALSGAEEPVLSGAVDAAQSEAKVPDTPPVLKAQPDAAKPLSLDPVDRQLRESNHQAEHTSPSIPSKSGGPAPSGAEGLAPNGVKGPTLNGSDGLAPSGAEGPKTKPESTRQLSIAQARTLALENNLDLKIAQVDPKLAATAVSQEQAKFDDLIFARAKYSRKQLPPDITEIDTLIPTDPTSPSKGTTVLRVDSEQLKQFLDIDAGISIPLRTGGKITLSVPFDEKSVAKKGFEQGQYAAALRFSISQPLLRGGGIDNNVAGIRIAQYEQQAVDVKTRLQSIRVLAAVERAYWGVYVAWGELDVRLQQYENAADNLAMVKKRVAAGLTAAVELNRAEIGVAERMEGLILTETTLKIRERQLKLFLNDPGLTLDSSTLLVPDTTPTLVEFKFNREQLAQRALAGRLELLELELKLAADLTKIDYLRNQTLPMFMLDYSYGTPGTDISSFGGAFGQATSGDFSDWSVGVRMEMPLTNELRRAQLDRAVQERLQRLTTQQLRELSVRREIYDALDQVAQNWQRILAARQNVMLAGLNYDAELKQFSEGLRTMTEVLETLTRLGEAQLREVRAIGDYQVSIIDLAFATGTLLGHSRVGWDRAVDGS